MLYIDGVSLSKLIKETKNTILNKKLTKLYQYDKDSISLFFGKNNLYFSINPSLPIFFLSDRKEETLSAPLSFSLSLKKYILGGLLVDIKQKGFDRITIFTFSKLNELGEKKNYHLIVEIMGKHSNLFLLDDNYKILDLLKKLSLEENRLRTIIQGVKYQYPETAVKKSPLAINEKEFYDEIKNSNPSSFLEGLGKLSDKKIDLSFEKLNKYISSDIKPTFYIKDRKISALFFEIDNEFNDCKKESFDSINSMINEYIKRTIFSQKFFVLFSNLQKIVLNEINKTKKAIKYINSDIKKYSKFESNKIKADILSANLFSIKYGMESVELFDFYNNQNITLTLNPNLKPSENLNKLYNKYNKEKRGFEFNKNRLEVVNSNLDYLYSIDTTLSISSSLQNLKDIEEELIDAKIIKKSQNSKSKKREKKRKNRFDIEKILSEDKYEILIGKNNRENDYLTFKVADKDDIWLHAKDIPGSHIIIRNGGNSLNDNSDTILKAASLAAFYSKNRDEKLVKVDYTLKKFVKKIPGSKPGMVTYKYEKAIMVEPKK